MDIQELKDRKKALKLTTAQLAYLAELPVGTVSKIMTGETKSPSFLTIEKLDRTLAREEMLVRIRRYVEAYIKYVNEHPEEQVDQISFEKEYRREHDLDNVPLPYAMPKGSIDIVDGNLALVDAGRATAQILSDIGEDRRIELVDGHLIVSEMPGLRHQLVVQRLGEIIGSYIKEHKGKCLVFSVGVNVRLDEDDYTVVIPDVTVLCDRSKLDEKGIVGAPDWTIEIVSPTTRTMDYRTKMCKYMNAGVREYWIIDLEKEKVVTYIEGEPMMAYVYELAEDVPVKIYDGELIINVGSIVEGL